MNPNAPLCPEVRCAAVHVEVPGQADAPGITMHSADDKVPEVLQSKNENQRYKTDQNQFRGMKTSLNLMSGLLRISSANNA